jgi:signal transduction histidine kinase
MNEHPPAATRASFPFAKLARDAIVVVPVCLACAVIITVINGKTQYFFENLVFSVVIGGTAFLLIDVARLALWGVDKRPRLLPFLAILLVSVPLAQFGGTVVAGLLLGMKTPPLGRLIAGPGSNMLAFTLIMTAAAALFLHHRDKALLAEAAAAVEKARAEAVARQALQAQLQLLQAQIEPHMLFNTLANVQGMIGIDPAGAQQMLDQLIQYLRSSLASSRAQSTTLAQEFALMEAYLGLMAVRMGARLSYSLQLPEALRAAQIAPMLLQPLVENAISHGLEPKVEGGHVSVSAVRAGGSLLIRVSDTGLGLDAPSPATGTKVGVANTRERLHALFGEQGSLTLEPNLPHGATALLTLPLRLP